MTSLDPTHIPGFERTSDPTTGQAVKTSVSTEPTTASAPSWKGAWKRRQEAKLAAQRHAQRHGHRDSHDDDDNSDDDDDDDERRDDAKIPIPPIPDLRYEQGILSSIRPFLHSSPSTTTTTTTTAATEHGERGAPHESREHQEKLETVEKVVLASSQLTAEGPATEGKGSPSDALMSGPLRIEWGMVSYVLFRDQVVFPLLQGVLWGMAGIYLNGLWEWNRERLAGKNSAEGARRVARGTGPSLLSRLGLTA
ncbi:hypothetical protein JCM11491_003735 [Sporobolomyces phaffii]